MGCCISSEKEQKRPTSSVDLRRHPLLRNYDEQPPTLAPPTSGTIISNTDDARNKSILSTNVNQEV
jgi:hypothetical protein